MCLQEVIIVEDDNGQIVRETLKDNDGLMQYRTMRETLIYLSHLDYEDTEYQMLEKLRSQMGGSWTWDALNTLCWAIGSISGSMHVSLLVQAYFTEAFCSAACTVAMLFGPSCLSVPALLQHRATSIGNDRHVDALVALLTGWLLTMLGGV